MSRIMFLCVTWARLGKVVSVMITRLLHSKKGTTPASSQAEPLCFYIIMRRMGISIYEQAEETGVVKGGAHYPLFETPNWD